MKLGIMGLAAPPAAFCKMETGHIEEVVNIEMVKGQSAFNKICFNNACLFLNNRGLAQPKDILLNIDTVQRQMCKYSRNAKTCKTKKKHTLH